MRHKTDILQGYESDTIQKAIVFGAGYYGVRISYLLLYSGVDVVACMDNNSQNHGKKMFGKIPCMIPCLIDKEIPVIISVRNEVMREEVRQQCMEMGYTTFIYPKFENILGEVDRLPDKEYLELGHALYIDISGIDWDNLKTFNDKLQWLKLYNRNPEYTNLVDKYEVKKIIAERLGEEYVIPTLGVWNFAEDIEWDKLPEKFVLKCTHDSGSVVVCRDKERFNVEETKQKIREALKVNYYYAGREWVYKDITPRVIAEAYIVDDAEQELRDYKFYCFDGHVEALLLATNRLSTDEPLCFDYFDANFTHLNWTNHWHPNAKVIPGKPSQFDKMKEIAKELSKGFPHIRIDLYEANGKIYFGEFTFFDQGGYLKIHPSDWEMIFGNLIHLPIG